MSVNSLVFTSVVNDIGPQNGAREGAIKQGGAARKAGRLPVVTGIRRRAAVIEARGHMGSLTRGHTVKGHHRGL